jgi:DNA-binding transcriptional LysR family regulator
MGQIDKIDCMDWSSFDLNLLPVLRALLEEQSVTRAARRLRLSQSATSAALARLRSALGDELLAPHGRGLALTPRGRLLLSRLPAALDGLRLQLSEVQSPHPGPAVRTIRLRMPDFVAATAMPLIEPRLRHAGPVTLTVTSPTQELPVAEFERGELDLMLASRIPLPPGWMTRTLYRERFVVLLSPRHKSLARWGLESYLQSEHLLLSPRGGAVAGAIDEVLAKLGRQRYVAVKMSSASAMPALLRDARLVAAVPARYAELVAKPWGLAIKELPFVVPAYGVLMIWHRSLQQSAPHRWLREQLAAVLK